MEAFEKWENTKYHDYYEQGVAEAAWKAALEWVLGGGGPLSDGIHSADYAKLRIKKELEDS